MVDSKDMRERARRCIRLAGKSNSITINLALLQIASRWMALAELCERGDLTKEEAVTLMIKSTKRG